MLIGFLEQLRCAAEHLRLSHRSFCRRSCRVQITVWAFAPYHLGMPARSSAYSRPVEDALTKRLKEELWSARNAILELMSEEAREILTSYYHCATIEETYTWEAHIAEDLIPLAKPLPRVSAYQIGDRAMCPLCGRQAQSLHEDGFACPEGLLRHFEGRGRVHRCSVIEAARGLAEVHWDLTFFPRNSEERKAFVAKIEARRRQETLFLVHPYQAPRLLDEGLSSHQARDEEGLEWANARLMSLGFKVTHEANVSACTRGTANAVAYADPRRKGAVSFQVLLKPVSDTLPYWERRRVASRTFAIADTREHGLEGQVEKNIADAVRELAPTLRSVSDVE